MDIERLKVLIGDLKGIECSRSRDGTARRRRARDLEMLLILSWLWQWPLASAKDLHGMGLFGLSKIHDLLEAAEKTDLVVQVRLGSTFDSQNRCYLDIKGVHRVMDYYGNTLEWQVTEHGVKRLVERLRMVEAFYRILPGLWRLDILDGTYTYYSTPDPESPPLTLDDRMHLVRVHWVRTGPTHAVAQYRTGEGYDVWVPVHWYGVHHNDQVIDDLGDFFEGLDTRTDHRDGAAASPAGLVEVAIDQFAAFRAKRLYTRGLPMAIVTPQGRCFGRLTPKYPSGSVNGTGDLLGKLGEPARVAAWLDTPEMAAVNGVTNRRVLEWVESWPGSLTVDVARGGSQPRSNTAAILKGLQSPLENLSTPDSAPRRLVQKMEQRRLHLGKTGILAASRRDRTSYQTALSPLGGYLNPEGRWRRGQSDHNRRVVKVALRFQKSMFVAPGWRLVINYNEKTQLAPDLWLQVPWDENLAVWHCVEYEQSAKTVGAVIVS